MRDKDAIWILEYSEPAGNQMIEQPTIAQIRDIIQNRRASPHHFARVGWRTGSSFHYLDVFYVTDASGILTQSWGAVMQSEQLYDVSRDGASDVVFFSTRNRDIPVNMLIPLSTIADVCVHFLTESQGMWDILQPDGYEWR